MMKKKQVGMSQVVVFLLLLLMGFFLGCPPLGAEDWSGVPTWNPGDGRDVIKSLSVIEPGKNLVVAESEESLGNYYADVLLYTMDNDGNKLTGPFHYGGSWTAQADGGFSEYDSESGQYIFNVFGREYVSYEICQATFFRVYEDGTYVQNSQGENWHHFFNPEGDEFIDAKSVYYGGRKLSNKTYLAVGSIQAPNASNASWNALAVCFSSDGEILWYRIFDGSEVGQVFGNIDRAVDCVEHNGFVYILIDTKSEGPGSEFKHNNYKIVKLDMKDGSYLNGQVFGQYGDDKAQKIFVYNGNFLVYGYTSANLPDRKIFVDQISFDFLQASGFPLIFKGDDDNDYTSGVAVIKDGILHATGSVLVDANNRAERLFHMGVNLETKELIYLKFVGAGDSHISYTGRGVLVTANGDVLAGGQVNDATDFHNIQIDYFLSFLETDPGSNAVDFNADGSSDLLWRNDTTGVNYLWYFDGLTYLGGARVSRIEDTNWQIVGLADFNQDSHPDILWRNTSTGDNYVWYMDDNSKIGGHFINKMPDTDWHIVGVSDFNGDSHPDILWRNMSTGANYLWYLDDCTRTDTHYVASLSDTDWHIVGTADFNSDSHPDILWRNYSTGENYIYYMNDWQKTGSHYVSRVTDVNWAVGQLTDFNSDGQVDILWRNQSTGDNYVWYLNDWQKTGGSTFKKLSDLNWHMAEER